MAAEFGQGHAPARALEQGVATLPFQLADLSADVGLCGLPLRRHLGEAACLDHFEKQAEVLNLHGLLGYAFFGMSEMPD
jgi:hypothetical protein